MKTNNEKFIKFYMEQIKEAAKSKKDNEKKKKDKSNKIKLKEFKFKNPKTMEQFLHITKEVKHELEK